jgi:hypothetical protein
MTPFDETRARRYLLGQLSEEETTTLETEYFASSETLERVADVETDLVDDFVAGALGDEDRAAFEAHYLASAPHRDRVATARVLRAAIPEDAAPGAPRWRVPAWAWLLPVAAVIVLLLAGRWLGERPPVRREPVARVEATPPSPVEPAAMASAPGRSPDPGAAPRTTVAAFTLSPVLLRGGQATPELRVPPGTDELALTLEGERPDGVPPGTALAFEVMTVEGARVTSGRVQVASAGLGVAHVGADTLPPGDYILSVLAPRDPAPLARYYFRVPR